MTLDTVEIKAFVPARDFALSKRFYEDLGFTLAFSDEDLAYLRAGNCSFLLQRFHAQGHAANFMMHLLVADADAWWERARRVADAYGVRAEPPQDRPWRIRDFVLTDPSGVLWRIGHNLPTAPQAQSVVDAPTTIGAIAQLRTTDLEGSIAFYTHTLGMALRFRHGDFYAGIEAGGQLFHLKRVDTPDPSIAQVRAGTHFHLYFPTSDASGLAERLQARGVALRVPVHETDWGTREFVIEDDQGHTLYFGQALPAR